MLFVSLVSPSDEVMMTTYFSYSVRFSLDEVPITGLKTGGVKGISLKELDYVVSVNVVPENTKSDLILITHRGAVKKMSLHEIEPGGRAKRGVVTLRELKTNAHRVFAVVLTEKNEALEIVTDKGNKEVIQTNTMRASDRYSNGSLVIDAEKDGQLVRVRKQPTEPQ